MAEAPPPPDQRMALALERAERALERLEELVRQRDGLAAEVRAAIDELDRLIEGEAS